MGISPRLLGEGEYVVVATRTHVKALLKPALLLIVICLFGGFAAGMVPQEPPLLVWLIWALGAFAIGRWVVWPFLDWLGASYTVTNHRVVTREGVFTRRGHDIPLRRINDVSYEHGLVDRLLGCGTLVIAAASERGEVVLPDVPSVEQLHLRLTELLMDEGQHDRYEELYDDDGYDDPPYEPDSRWRR